MSEGASDAGPSRGQGPPENEAPPDEFPEMDDEGIFGADGAMDPEHPLLARAQAALKSQLKEAEQRLKEELREKSEALRRARKEREEIGVELYGAQQHLAGLQVSLEQAHEKFEGIADQRQQTEQDVVRLREAAEVASKRTAAERRRVDAFQGELDKLAETLKQIEMYNEQVRGEIAVTKRAAHAAEEAVQKLEKEKLEQDLRIDRMQEQLKTKHQELAVVRLQLDAQRKETAAAKQTLAEAELEMEGIHFEKKQLSQQWRSALVMISRRVEALRATESAIKQQDEEHAAMVVEVDGTRRDVLREEQRNEQLTAVLKKVQGEATFLQRQIAALVARQDEVRAKQQRAEQALDVTEGELEGARKAGRQLASESERLDREYVKVSNSIQELATEMLTRLSDQVTLEKSASKAVTETRETRARVQAEELAAINLQNELAKVEVDILNTTGHNEQLEEALRLLDREMHERSRAIEKYEQDLRSRNDAIEKKTKYVDHLNKMYDRLTAGREEESMGPLESTISNLRKEILQKGVEGKELQRRWINFQTELVGVVNDNNAMEEAIQRRKAEITVIMQKRRRLEQQYEHTVKDIKGLDQAVARMQGEMQRLNGLIAKNAGLQQELESDNFNLQNKVLGELRSMEEEAARLESKISGKHEEKRAVMADIVETERQIMLWERKIQLEKEMQEAIDPEVGREVVEAMRKEIHRMKLRFTELLRLQERLITEMERGISKRGVIGDKGRSFQAKKGSFDATAAGAKKRAAELKRSIRATEQEAGASESRIRELEEARGKAAEESERVAARCHALRQEEQDLRAELGAAASRKVSTVVSTAKLQRLARRFEELAAGRHRPVVEGMDRARLAEEASKAEDRRSRLVQAMNAIKTTNPGLAPAMERLTAQILA
ncbi:unnamed protein product [Pedinophyceae sp. YPF-701]|nr:unnamed protein product [Pedinophyceae sp. YPF-701]